MKHLTDSEFLQWIHDRLVDVHDENDMNDYMWRLRDIIDAGVIEYDDY